MNYRYGLVAAAIVSLAGSAMADWAVGDPYAMHYPQLPDPNGWDVKATLDSLGPNMVADDWQSPVTGAVSDIHFWGSWRGDNIGQIRNINMSIRADIPAGTGGVNYSQPGEVLWQWSTDGFQIAPVDPPSFQGWLDPLAGIANPNDHQSYFQYNIDNIPNPFIQTAGTIYWLTLSVDVLDPGTIWGWKTSLDHFNDDATYLDPAGGWNELIDPINGQSLDMAFVITPEPGAVSLVLLGCMASLRRRRRG